MALCSPYATPKFIERTEANDRGGVLSQLLQRANEFEATIKTREGFDQRWLKDYQTILRNTLPMDWDQLTAYYMKNGWIKVDKKASKEAGTDVFKLGKIDAETAGMAAAVTKTYLESVGGGIQQAADNFLMKVNAGEAATQEGLFLASQMQHASRFAGFVLGWDQGYGRAVRAQGLRNQGPEVMRTMQDVAESGATEGMTEAMGDAFKQIAAKMQDPDQYVDAINDLVALAKRVKFADSPLQAFRISSSIELAGSAWNEVWVNGLLSSPATMATNALSVTWAVARPMAQFMSAKAYEIAGFPGKEFAQQAAAEAGATLTAMYTALTDGLKLGWQAFKTEQSIYAPLMGSTELAKGRAITGAAVSEFAARRGWDQQADQYAEMFDTLGKFVRLPSRALLGSDEFVKHLVTRGEVAARGIQAAAKAGVDMTDKAALKAFVDQEFGKAFRLDAPDLKDKYAVQRMYDYAFAVRDEANVATFQEQNGLASRVNRITTGLPMLKPFIPFVRTPLNILKQGFYESTGIGAAVKAGRLALANPTKAHLAILDELARDPGESFRVAGQIAMTGALAAGIYAGVMNGQIVGGGPGRWGAKGGKLSDQQRAWERAMAEEGKTPYSVITPMGAVPFDRFGEPVAIVMRMVADVAQYSGEISDDEKDEAMFTIAGIMASGLYQASFLKGIDDLMGAFFGDTDTGALKARAVQNYVATQTPFGGLLNYIDKATDPFKKAYSGASFVEVMRVHEDSLGTGLFARFADRIPGVSTAPMLIDQVTGKPVPVYPGGGSTGLNPFQMAIPFLPRGERSADQTWNKIYQIMGSYTESRPQGMRLTNEEQQQLNREMASVRLNGLTFAEWIDSFHASSEVQSYIRNKNGAMTDLRDGIEAEFSRMKTAYMNQALDNLSVRNSNLLQRRSFLETAREKARANDLSYEQDLSAMDALFQRARRGF